MLFDIPRMVFARVALFVGLFLLAGVAGVCLVLVLR